MVDQLARPLIFGEVLFDHFPDGQRILGGAPFNVAWNLKGFGLDPLFVSSIGDDEDGREVVEKMEAWGMDTSGLSVSETFPTGSVKVTIEDNEPAYDILDDQAYDYIDPPDNIGQQPFSIFYHGSLAARHTQSRNALYRIRSDVEAHRFVDLNIRRPHFDDRQLRSLIIEATWVKLNQHELAEITHKNCESLDDLQQAAIVFLKENICQNLWVTRGGEGACWFDQTGEMAQAASVPISNLVDTVGAGDGFAAVTIYGLHKGWSAQQILEQASSFGARLCQQRGATLNDPGFYQLGHMDAG